MEAANHLIKGTGPRDTIGLCQSLQFADDTLIFCTAHGAHVVSLKFILYSFELLTGLKINFEKSVVLGLGIQCDHRDRLAHILGCTSANFSLKYLGIQLHFRKLRSDEWMPLLEKIINATITPIVTYWMSSFMLPLGIIKRIDKLHRAFLWCGEDKYKAGKSLLNWSSIYHPKKYGGLGIINLKMLNMVLLCRWWWKLFLDTPKSWSILVKAAYYKDHLTPFKSLNQKQLSHFCNDAQQVRKTFRSLIKFQIGDGLLISLWNDCWLSDYPLRDQFP